jgi:UDP-N-acetylmuramyl tripeptide synthase
VLLEHFRELQDSSKQRAVVNIDDEAAAAVLQAASGVPCITFGIHNAKADVRVESLDLSLWRTTVRTVHAPAQLSTAERSTGSFHCQGVVKGGRRQRKEQDHRHCLVVLSSAAYKAHVHDHMADACLVLFAVVVLLQMIVATPVGRLEIITNLIGRHNVYNVLAAVAVGVLLNLPLEDIGAGVESVQFVPGRWVGGWGV